VVVDSIEISSPDSIIITETNHEDVACYGDNSGSITIDVTGGTPGTLVPYLVQWNDPSSVTGYTISNLTGGSYYTVTVTDDAFCVVVDSFYIAQPVASLSLTTDSSDAGCGTATGSVSVTASGGTSPFSYLWDSSAGSATTSIASDLSAGIYSVTVTDDNLCSAVASVEIMSSGSVTTSISVVSDITCYGDSNGEVEVTGSGGVEPYSYSWSTGGTNATETGLSSGYSFVTVTDASGCSGSDSIELIEPTEIIVNTSIVDVDCYGGANGEVSLTVQGGSSPYSYEWSNGMNTADVYQLSSGTYVVTISDDNLCSKSVTVVVNQPANGLGITLTSSNVSCYGEFDGSAEVAVEGGTSPYTYLWNDPEGQTSSIATGLAEQQTLSVVVTDANGCTITENTSVEQPQQITIDQSTLQLIDASCKIGIDGSIDLDISGGTEPLTYYWSNDASTEDISGLTAGDYSLTIEDANYCSFDTIFTIGAEDVECLLIPTAITPNNDGVNDTWDVDNIEIYDQVNIKIFNRWGNLVWYFDGTGEDYSSTDVQFDGISDKGNELPHASYVYIIEIFLDGSDEAVRRSGAIAIIR